METHTPMLDLGPISFDLTILAMTGLTVALVFLLVLWASSDMSLKPKGKQNVLEWLYDFVIKVIGPNLGPVYAKKYALFYFTLFTFLLVANNLGLVAKIEGHHHMSYWMSPTANMFYALALALMISLYNNYQSLKINGVKGYFKEFITPPAMTFFHVLEEFTNVLSLGLRLFGNIFAGEVVIDLIIQLSHFNPLAGPLGFVLSLLWIGFSVFISCLQAYVFVLLSSMYLGKKINHHSA